MGKWISSGIFLENIIQLPGGTCEVLWAYDRDITAEIFWSYLSSNREFCHIDNGHVFSLKTNKFRRVSSAWSQTLNIATGAGVKQKRKGYGADLSIVIQNYGQSYFPALWQSFLEMVMMITNQYNCLHQFRPLFQNTWQVASSAPERCDCDLKWNFINSYQGYIS